MITRALPPPLCKQLCRVCHWVGRLRRQDRGTLVGQSGCQTALVARGRRLNQEEARGNLRGLPNRQLDFAGPGVDYTCLSDDSINASFLNIMKWRGAARV